MKKFISTTAALILALIIFLPQNAISQSPQKMSYQSVVRDASGNLVVESPVGIQISILQGSAVGTAAYAETHTAITNVNGLVSLEMGMGTMITGTFAGIDWGNGPYFVKTEIDPSGGVTYSMSATTELLSVPFALYAKTANNIEGPLEVSMDAADTTFNSPVPTLHEGAFVAIFENTNPENGDGIKIKLGKNRTLVVPTDTIPPTQEEIDAQQEMRDLLDSATPLGEKQDILAGLIEEGVLADAETIAGLAVGAGNLVVGFINDGIGLPLDVGLIINDGIGLPWDVAQSINSGIGLPYNFTQPINDILHLPWEVDISLTSYEVFPTIPPLEIPAIPPLVIPGIPEEEIITYEYQCPAVSPDPSTLSDDFEGDGLNWSSLHSVFFFPTDNPGPNAVNSSANCAIFQPTGSSSASAQIRFNMAASSLTPGCFDLVDNHTFSIKVYPTGVAPGTITDVTFRLSGSNYSSPYSEITKPLVLNQWNDVSFNFETDNWVNSAGNSVDPVNRVDLCAVQIFFNGALNSNIAGFVCFVDDFSYDGPVFEIVDTVVEGGTICETTGEVAEVSQTFTETITDLRIPAIPTIPEFSIGGITITPIEPWNLEYWGIESFDLSDLGTETLSNENEFIRFSDANDSKMGAIRAVSKANWASDYLNPFFFKKVRGIIKSTSDKKHMQLHLKSLMATAAIDFAKLGVEYSSSYGDYAEWLERADPDENIRAGSIVGVVGGKISKDLRNAEQVMVVSHNPIVLGNVPEVGETHLGNNIAFVGQVPVKIMGVVHTGDYIIANPATPGYGYAKNPTEMSIEELNLVVGRSWEDSLDEGPKMVNTVVGVHNGDYVSILKSQAQRLESLESDMKSVLQILSVEANNK